MSVSEVVRFWHGQGHNHHYKAITSDICHVAGKFAIASRRDTLTGFNW